MIVKLKKLALNFNKVILGDLTLFFSYETCIAFTDEKGNTYFKIGSWPPSTKKHCLLIRGENTAEIKLPADEFEAAISNLAHNRVNLGGTPTAETGFFILDMRQIKANTHRNRKYGVMPNLNGMGFGLFEKLKGHEDKEPLWVMLTSNKPAMLAQAVALVDKYEPDIKEFAISIAGFMQLHNIGVVLLDETDPKKGYDVVYGMQHCLARAYNYARSFGFWPITVKAEIAGRAPRVP